jgi:hypothetical protein
MHFSVAVSQMNVDGFAFKFFEFGSAGVGENQMADVDVGANAWMIAFVNEADHRIDIIEETEAKRFEFERNVDLPFVGIITDAAAGFEGPIPLRFGRNDFALPHVFAQDEEDVFGVPRSSEVDELLGAFDVEFADRRSKIDEAEGANRKGNNRQVQLFASVRDETDFLFGNVRGFGVNIDTIETDAGDVLEAVGSIHTGLVKCAVDDAEFHGLR